MMPPASTMKSKYIKHDCDWKRKKVNWMDPGSRTEVYSGRLWGGVTVSGEERLNPFLV